MNAQAEPLLLSLLGPGTIAIFAVAYVWTWFITNRRHHYLLIVAAAMLLPLPGALFQVLAGPENKGVTTVGSGVLFMGASILAAEGMARRYRSQIGVPTDIVLLVVASTLQAYFWYVEPNFQARAYLVNFFCGGYFIVAALRSESATRGRTTDRAVFWVMLAYGIFLFPRTVLFAWPVAEGTLAAFDNPLFWQVATLSTAVFATALGLFFLVSVLTEHMEDLRRDRDFDRLTGVLNRRGFEERAAALMAKPATQPMCLILCDLDHFKRVNDTYGHRVGDDVLRMIGGLLQGICRKGDVLGRIGGEEFALLLPNQGPVQVELFVERMQDAIRAADFSLPEGAPPIHASMGIAMRQGNEAFPIWFDRADTALYQAKAEGRNRAIFVLPGEAGESNVVSLAGACAGPG